MSDVLKNRELSWIDFNNRVLDLTGRKDMPLLERINFFEIYNSNIDEFFSVRWAMMYNDMVLDSSKSFGITHQLPCELIFEARKKINKSLSRRDKAFREFLPCLSEHGINFAHGIFSQEQKQFLKGNADCLKQRCSINVYNMYDDFKLDFLEPDCFYISCLLRYDGKEYIGLIKTAGGGFVLNDGDICCLYSALAENAGIFFEGYEILAKTVFKVNRSCDLDPNQYYDVNVRKYLDNMTEFLKIRSSLEITRVVFDRVYYNKPFADRLLCSLQIDDRKIFIENSPLDMSWIQSIDADKYSYLKYSSYPSKKTDKFDLNGDLFEQIYRQDKLLCLPFEPFEPFIRLLEQASADREVSSIKITVYRVAKNSRVINALINAAGNGKQVTVLVELRARFDEVHNIEVANRLIQAGCKVILGFRDFKTHSKVCLIERNGGSVVQVSTGNYNETTAEIYTDLSVITANAAAVEDTREFFNALENGQIPEINNLLITSPTEFKRQIIGEIAEQIALAKSYLPCYIGIKCNGLNDKEIIDALVDAAKSNVKTQACVRGVNCLRFSQEDYFSPNIQLKSIVGRFLEHSRIYIFGQGEHTNVYISSADLMKRNTAKRVETAFKITDPQVKAEVINIFNTVMQDDSNAYEMKDNEFVKLSGNTVNSHEIFMQQANPEELIPEPFAPDIATEQEPDKPVNPFAEFIKPDTQQEKAEPISETAEPFAEPVPESFAPDIAIEQKMAEPISETVEPFAPDIATEQERAEPISEIAEPFAEPVPEPFAPDISTEQEKTEPISETAESFTEPVFEPFAPDISTENTAEQETEQPISETIFAESVVESYAPDIPTESTAETAKPISEISEQEPLAESYATDKDTEQQESQDEQFKKKPNIFKRILNNISEFFKRHKK